MSDPIADSFDHAEDVDLPPPPVAPGDRSGLPRDCPVKCLGIAGSRLFLLDGYHQLHEVPCEKLSRLLLLTLFGGPGYFYQYFPKYNAEGDVVPGKWSHERVGETIITACCDAGLISPGVLFRGRGGWRGRRGELIFHCGDTLWVDGREKPLGLHDGYVYPGGPPVARPLLQGARDTGPSGPAATLFKMLSTWHWSRGDIDAKLVMGSIGVGMLGAAPKWRPMLWATGDAGTGKSTVQQAIRLVHGENGIVSSADATRAALFQALGYDSLPISLDELEPDANPRRVQDIIDLALVCASGDVVLRGGADGQGMQFAARSHIVFSSVLRPSMSGAALSRMAIVDLLALKDKPRDEPGEDDAPRTITLDPRKLGEIGQLLRGRLVLGWPRYDTTFEAYRQALIRRGHNDRGADQFGALGAAYDLLMFDSFESSAAASWADALSAQVIQAGTDNMPDSQQCLEQLVSFSPQVFRSGKLETIAHWLKAARAALIGGAEADSENDAIRVLASIGIRVMPHPLEDETDGKGARIPLDRRCWVVLVANQHVGLETVFRDTRWGRGVWAQSLKRLPFAVPEQQRIDGRTRRCTMVGYDVIFDEEEKR